jgi:lisH domain-containing protein FOPNL
MTEQSSADLQAALVHNLQERGLLGKLRSELFAELLTTIQGSEDDSEPTVSSVPAPPAPPEALLINELIREYLSFTGLKHALHVFNLETSSGDASAADREALPRSVLADELGVKDNNGMGRPVPLLYYLVATARAARLAGQDLQPGQSGRSGLADATLTRATMQQQAPSSRSGAGSRPSTTRRTAYGADDDDDDHGLPGAVTRRTGVVQQAPAGASRGGGGGAAAGTHTLFGGSTAAAAPMVFYGGSGR